jgi:steroid Delta-isomerase
MNKAKAQATLSRFYAAICALDVEAWLSTFTEDAESQDPVGTPAMRGHAALRSFFNGLAGLIQAIDMRAERTYINGDSAAVKWRGEGRGKNGGTFSFEGIEVFEFDAEGRIRTVRAYWDPAPLFVALGVAS